MELDVGNRTVYLACVYKLVPVVWSDINSCVVLPWLAIDPMLSFSHIHLFLFISVDICCCFVTRVSEELARGGIRGEIIWSFYADSLD